MSDPKTLDEFFGPKTTGPKSLDEFFGPKTIDTDMSGPLFAEQLSPGMGTYAATVLDQFGHGFKNGWGTAPLGPDPHYFEKNLIDSMKKEGNYKSQKEAEDAVTERLNGWIMRPLAVALDNYMQGIVMKPLISLGDIAMRGTYSAARGLVETATPLAVPGAVVSTLMEGFIPELLPHTPVAQRITKAYDLGITEERFPGMSAHEEALQNTSPRGVESPTERIISEPTPPPEPLVPPADIHEAARRIDPETLSRYDELTDARETHRANLDDLKETATREAQGDLDAFIAEKGQPETIKNRADLRKLRVLERALEKARSEETPEMIKERLGGLAAEHEQWDLAPAVRDAYDKAREGFEPEPVPVEPVPPRGTIRTTMKDDQGRTFEIEPNPISGYDILTPEGVFYADTFPKAIDLVNGMTEGARVEEAISPGVSIADHIAMRAIDAGRPLPEANLIGKLWQAYYETRAAQFEGARGTARDLFNSEKPDIVSMLQADVSAKVVPGTLIRGFTNLVQNLIGLTEHQNASTLIHESGHFFLSNLVKDAAHPLAPPGLKADLAATLDWLKSKGELTVAQHEQFAKGFERYLMEGRAPTPALARVFEHFKEMLRQIYSSLREAGRANDTIRGVYDRLLGAADTREPVIASDPSTLMRDLGLLHQEEASLLFQKGRIPSKEEIFAAAEKMRAERDAAASILPTELENGRRRSRQSGAYALAIRRARELEAGRSEERAGLAPGDEVGAGVEPIREVSPTEAGEISPSGAVPKSEPPRGGRDSFERSASRVTNADGSARIENIWSPADVEQAARIDESNDPRGPITDKQAIDLSDASGISLEELQGNADRIGKGYNAAEIDRLREMVIAAENQAHDLMRAVADGAVDKVLEFAQAISRVEMIQGMIMNVGSEWGMAGQALKRLKEATGVSTSEQLNALFKTVSGRDYESLLQIAKLGQNLNSPATVGSVIRASRQRMSPFGRGVVYWVTNGYLSGPLTHAVYVAGNELRAVLMAPLETTLAATMGAAREVLSLGPKDRVYMREVGAQLIGLGKGTWDAMRPAWEAYKAGAQQPLPGATTAHGSPWQVISPFSKITENIIGQPVKIVSAIHQFGLVQFYTQYLYQYATRMAIDEGLNGTALQARIAELRNNPTADLMERARTEAQTAMYQRVTPYGSLQRKLVSFTDDYAMAKVVFPFNKIGFEMARETLVKRTPLGIVDSEIRGDLGLGNLGLGALGVRGGMPGTLARGGARFDETMGKMILGTGVFVGGLFLGAQGVLTGHGPEDPEEQRNRAGQGQQYSLTIGPYSVPLGGFGPQGNILKLAADIWEVHHSATQHELEQIALGYYKAILRATIDEGFLHSAMNLSEAINDPGKNAVRFVTNIIMSGAVPYGTAMSQINREFIDPYSKEIEPGLAGIFDAIRARTFGASQSVPNRLDMFGQPMPSRGIRMTRYENDPVFNWLNKLGIYPGRIDRTVWGVRLTEIQYNEFEQLAGMYTKEYLNGAVEAGVEDMTKGEQIWYLGRQTQKARKLARQEIAGNSVDGPNDIMDKSIQLKSMKFSDEPPRLGYKPQ